MSSAAGMVTSYRNNQNLKSKKISYFDQKTGAYKVVPTSFDFPEVSEEKLNRIKLRIRKKARRDRLVSNSIALVLSILAVIGAYWFLIS